MHNSEGASFKPLSNTSYPELFRGFPPRKSPDNSLHR